jgi:membrane associated rhomboid family serine protease
MILIPLRHENMHGRRWPIITFVLIGLNILAFLGTHWTMESQFEEMIPVRQGILMLAVTHPELKMGDAARNFVEPIAKKYPEEWKKLGDAARERSDSPEQRALLSENQEALQAQMDTLSQQYEELEQKSIADHYAFVPMHPSAISYLTANFLHAGWLHLIGNMWFLWLAGFILEDNWGRVIYTTFYVIAGAVALQFHGWIYPDSFVPLLGASGAIAALMGAFVIRFPKLKIEMFWAMFYVRGRFKAPAWCLLPLWALTEVFYGSLFGQMSGVAHWAHVGGFLFGMVGALAIRYTGLEQKATAVIDEKVGAWTADPAIVKAHDAIEHGKVDEAILLLREHLKIRPDSADACHILQQLYWRKGDKAAHHDITLKLCQLHMRAQNGEAAWQAYEEFTNTGGDKLPAAVWLELCRFLEGQQNFDRAVSEYEKLAQAYPSEKQGLLSLIAAGRLALKQLGRPSEALRYYQAAAASPVSHADWESNIQIGIEKAKAALLGMHVPAGKV